ncbi:fas apoptotic inhibitory molecule 3 [Fukomys damarensis]|uniref:fas apoptotic inhibitory molecule 3 n=1 Tax=Fukomys damarensis TaxID=885580 RepID=UPI00053F8476|nr:fas apoptotic inhibitory molecule 3 [Fukomys damarensis]
MDLWLWWLYFLPVSRALKILPEVELQGVLGGSVVIECPLQGDTQVRMYLCRQMANPKTCTTVVSSYFVKEGYKHRVTLMPCSDRNLFLVELMGLTESDSGVYACGLGRSTDQGKTLKVTLSVHNEYEPFWEEDPMAEPQDWFHKALPQMPGWLQMAAHDRPSNFISKDAAAQRTEAPLALRSTALVPTAHRSQTPRASSAAASMPPTPLPSREASKTSVQEGVLGPQEASYKHHTWLHGQRASSSGSAAGREDLGFHILIPSALGLLLLALLGLVLRRAVQRRRGEQRPWTGQGDQPHSRASPGCGGPALGAGGPSQGLGDSACLQMPPLKDASLPHKSRRLAPGATPV